MYYPYLRGKQFELLALRELSLDTNIRTKVIPIIEPYSQNQRSLILAVKELLKNKQRFALILNSQDKPIDKVALSEILGISDQNTEGMASGGYIPCYIYKEELQLDTLRDKSDIMLIVDEGSNPESTHLSEIINLKSIRYVVLKHPNNRSLRSLVKSAQKEVIRLDSCFRGQKRNADYAGFPDELFSEEHQYYQEDNFKGFGNYTVLPEKLVDGGMLPYAIAIHLVYPDKGGNLRIHHFVSESNEDNSNVHRKFKEAGEKIKPFWEEHNLEQTQPIRELIDKIDKESYPGLGYLKKLAIKHCITTTANLLK